MLVVTVFHGSSIIFTEKQHSLSGGWGYMHKSLQWTKDWQSKTKHHISPSWNLHGMKLEQIAERTNLFVCLLVGWCLTRRSVLLVEETTDLSQVNIMLYRAHLAMNGIQTHNYSGTDCTCSCTSNYHTIPTNDGP